MTLHEAIEKLVIETGKPLSVAEITEALARNKWFTKNNGESPKRNQISARISKHPKLFNMQNGIVSLESMNSNKGSMTNKFEHLYKLKEDFLAEWPLERLKKMSLSEYTNLDKSSSFCYWLEHTTADLGSVKGGSSFKFGVYERGNKSKVTTYKNRSTDGTYAWFNKYGSNAQEAFESIRDIIVEIAQHASKSEPEKIEEIDLGHAIRWKIAFLYSDYKLLNIFHYYSIVRAAKYFDYSSDDQRYSALNQFLLTKKNNKDFYGFSKELWHFIDNHNPQKDAFEKWLKVQDHETSNKSSSYLRAIDILEKEFDLNIYDQQDINKLKELYTDLVQNQKDQEGKYFYENAKSYGNNGFYSASVKSYITFLDSSNQKDNQFETRNMKLNQILYGPPGTGKTYNTKAEAVKIVNPKFQIIDSEDGRKDLNAEYERLVEAGVVQFCTFHQSMSYEDFVEGIKPSTRDEQVTYDVEDGIFKEMAIAARGIGSGSRRTNAQIDFSEAAFFKVSLGGKNRKDIHNWCIENNCIALGYGKDNDFSKYPVGRGKWKDFRDEFNEQLPELVEESRYNVQAVFSFRNHLIIGDVVLASLGNHIVDAIGIVEGDYEYRESEEIPFHHFRKVKWLATGLNISPSLFLDKKISQQTIYEFNPDDVKVEEFKRLFQPIEKEESSLKNHVLIIDEINRGNVSAIFGELITLLEPDKRAGEKEALEVTLPYSKEKFSVPNNLYIIGTMNTADRSVEALDTALRRRFSFVEMMPKPDLVESFNVKHDKLQITMNDILTSINARIDALLDREKTIGHSYFFDVNSLSKLKSVFKNNIIPLLQEHFYNDYEKMEMVIGSHFFIKIKRSTVKFALTNNDYNSEGDIYQIEDIDKWSDEKMFNAIYYGLLLKPKAKTIELGEGDN